MNTMEYSESFESEAQVSDEEYVPAAVSTLQCTDQGNSHSRRGAAGGSAGPGRRRRLRYNQANLDKEDVARVNLLRSQRIEFEHAQIQRLTPGQAQQVLERCLTRYPSLIFDVMGQLPAAPHPFPPVSGQPTWCICSRCRAMATLVEMKCCNQQPDMCVSTLPQMEQYILQEGVLRLARTIWNDLRAVADVPEEGEDNRQFRHAAYRQYVAWQCGTLGAGNRVVIPSCVVWAIRDRFPDPNGQYRGFIPRQA
ncbi:P2X purinoceptor 7-like [Misgurnus anguillicaudatus]|uniref:P2X purinoceptor 7-like n=1 Tax=Misgurnus anguillicaudatus TaxID=75329 RepID=UPI003CCFADD3